MEPLCVCMCVCRTAHERELGYTRECFIIELEHVRHVWAGRCNAYMLTNAKMIGHKCWRLRPCCAQHTTLDANYTSAFGPMPLSLGHSDNWRAAAGTVPGFYPGTRWIPALEHQSATVFLPSCFDHPRSASSASRVDFCAARPADNQNWMRRRIAAWADVGVTRQEIID